MKTLMENIGYYFKNPSLLSLALKHPSTNINNASALEDNQRLEFLGDSVIQLLISHYLYNKYPNYDEGKLTSLRTKLVCKHSLVLAAKHIELGKYLILSHGHEQMGGRTNAHNLEDAFEAMMGAVFLDSDINGAKAVLFKIFDAIKSSVENLPINYKGNLQEYLQSKKMPLPEYRLLLSSGPDHNKNFKIGVFIDDNLICSANEKSIKSAEQEVARIALEKLKRGYK